jgi:hypothetical protein
VLETVLAEVDLRAVTPASEGMTRRGITFTPAGQATAIVTRRPPRQSRPGGTDGALATAA